MTKDPMIDETVLIALREGKAQTLDELEKWVVNFGAENINERCSFCLGAVLKEINAMRKKK